MTTYVLPSDADGMPSSWALLPVINQQVFAARNLDSQRELGGGSRFSLRLTYNVRTGRVHERLVNVFEAASVPGDDLLVRFASSLGYDPGDNIPTVVTSAIARARSRTIPVNVATTSVIDGKLFSADDRLYRTRNHASVGTGRTITVGWPLRADIPAGTSLRFHDPRAKFVVVAEPPSFPVRGYNTRGGKREIGGPLIVELVELR